MKFNGSCEDETIPFPTVDEDGFRILGLYGPLTDKKAAEIVFSMMALRHSGEKIQYNLTDEQKAIIKEAEEEGRDYSFEEGEIEEETIFEPFEFLISTPGGMASEMLGIYDIMCSIRDIMEIHTFGVAKVMSAGVPLLAAGTKGKRRIGANCRVMMHSVLGGAIGNLQDITVEAKEIEFMQSQYIKILVAESNMSEDQVKDLLKTGTNSYLSAEEAIDYGICDIIV